MLTERQIDFNINLWDVCSSGNPSDNSPCAIAIATQRPQWFAVQFIQSKLIELSTLTLPRDARTLALRPSQTNRYLSVGKLREARARDDDGGARMAGTSGSRKQGNSSRRDFLLFPNTFTTSWSHPIKRTRTHTSAPPLWHKWPFLACMLRCAERVRPGSRLASVLTLVCDASIVRARARVLVGPAAEQTN